MIVRVDGFKFTFPDATHAYVFDEKDKNSLKYHGLSHAMKGVDLIVEFPNEVLFIEVKKFHEPDDYNFKIAENECELKKRKGHLNHLRDVLVHKFRDSWLYRWAEDANGAHNKPIHYLCVLTLDNGLLGIVGKELRQALPHGIAGPRWQRSLTKACVVLNPQRWSTAFPEWPLELY